MTVAVHCTKMTVAVRCIYYDRCFEIKSDLLLRNRAYIMLLREWGAASNICERLSQQEWYGQPHKRCVPLWGD